MSDNGKTDDRKTDRARKSFTSMLATVLKAAAVILIIVLLAVQVIELIELGVLLGKVSALEQPPVREEAPLISTPVVSPTPLAEKESKPAGLKISLTKVEPDDDGLTLTLEVRQSGPAALFFEEPVLEGKNTYEIDPDSLEKAKFTMLSLVTRGRAEIELRFTPAPEEGEDLTLIFNPNHPEDDPVAPKITVPVTR